VETKHPSIFTTEAFLASHAGHFFADQFQNQIHTYALEIGNALSLLLLEKTANTVDIRHALGRE
jgi:hypothetical protein